VTTVSTIFALGILTFAGSELSVGEDVTRGRFLEVEGERIEISKDARA
jgi:hypothetical protein